MAPTSARPIPEADAPVPPITELTRIEPVHLARLEKQGVFTTGILLEVSETATRRQSLADHVKATINDVIDVARRGADAQPRGLRPDGAPAVHPGRHRGPATTCSPWTSTRSGRGSPAAAAELGTEPPADLMIETWWEQARTLEEA